MYFELIVSLKTIAQVSKTMKNIIGNNLDIIIKAQKAVLRAYSMNKTFRGILFLLTPDIVVTNWHVSNSAEFPLYFSSSTELSAERFNSDLEALHSNAATFKDLNLAKERKKLYSGFTMKPELNHQVEKTEICQPRLDPVLGVTEDFNLFDLSLIRVNYPSATKVLFVPFSQFIQPGSNIATIGFPGIEMLNQPMFKYLNLPPTYEASLPPFRYLSDVFFGFGKKCVSVGTTIAPFGIVNNKWKGRLNYHADRTQYCIISNETVFFRNSGGPVICLDSCKTIKMLDKNKQEWNLVEFIGIHSSGEFINCLDCLQKLPEK